MTVLAEMQNYPVMDNLVGNDKSETAKFLFLSAIPNRVLNGPGR